MGTIVNPYYFDLISPALEKLETKALIRIKGNCYPKTHEISSKIIENQGAWGGISLTSTCTCHWQPLW